MQKKIFKTKGTCSRSVTIELDNGIINDVVFDGGCSGNALGIAALVKGMKAGDAIEKLEGIRCGYKETSCPDQLAKALVQMQNEAIQKAK
jgi:hypothetical protein